MLREMKPLRRRAWGREWERVQRTFPFAGPEAKSPWMEAI